MALLDKLDDRSQMEFAMAINKRKSEILL